VSPSAPYGTRRPSIPEPTSGAGNSPVVGLDAIEGMPNRAITDNAAVHAARTNRLPLQNSPDTDSARAAATRTITPIAPRTTTANAAEMLMLGVPPFPRSPIAMFIIATLP